MRPRALIEGLVVVALLLCAAPAAAQDAAAKQYVDVKIEEPPKRGGLDLSLKAGATFSLLDSRSVVGQPDGLTMTFGLKFDALSTYRNGKNEWRTSLGLNEALTRTPAVPEIFKSADALSLESTYLYFFRPWVGPFVRVTMATLLFRGFDARPQPTTYLVARADGSTDTLVAQRLPLTDPLRPTTLKESLGPFVRPASSEKLNAEVRAGLGALQTFAENQLVLADDAKTPAVEVKELKNIFQLGLEASFELWGALYDKKVTYKLGMGALVPFVRSNLPAEDERGPFALMNLDVGAALSFKLVEWASLDYEVKVMRQPQLTSVVQVRNGMMLTLGLGYERKAPTSPEKPADKKPAGAPGAVK